MNVPRATPPEQRHVLPDARMILKIAKGEIEVGLIEIGSDGLLCEIIQDKTFFDFLSPAKATIIFQTHDGFFTVEDLPCKVGEIKVIGYRKDNYPSYLRINYRFHDMPQKARLQLDRLLEVAQASA